MAFICKQKVSHQKTQVADPAAIISTNMVNYNLDKQKAQFTISYHLGMIGGLSGDKWLGLGCCVGVDRKTDGWKCLSGGGWTQREVEWVGCHATHDMRIRSVRFIECRGILQRV